MSIKHSKYKNTGILFELLVRRVTADTLNEKESPALKLIKKYFSKTELSKELKLYESVSKSNGISENQANSLIQTLLENSKRLNRKTLKSEKYNLISEIKGFYNLDEFFKTKLPNYKTFSSFFTLLEIYNTNTYINPDEIVKNKQTLLEQICKANISENSVKENLVNEFQTYDKDLRLLTYKLLLEKFNTKYSNLNRYQKQILKEFITSVDSTPKLREIYNLRSSQLKAILETFNKKVTDNVVKIKLNEVVSLLELKTNKCSVKSNDIFNLLQYFELIEELSKIHGPKRSN
ncbi:hypothetical protein [Haliea sp.]|uniref:hypothetical protein n=1 Tax=Haliea sp. TaxID=1932666 RepID=UPI00257C7EFE|nr:hypothetical protein [Haliea sp.]|tara:strand:+ start:834 stop:1706 length:873 start_codon:yes stop_codon:yes gene_type:complete